MAEVTITPIHDEAGMVRFVLRSSADISARKEAEERILRFNEDLERRVKERTAQLDLANSELEAFSYSVSHDQRAPLRSIDGFSRALLEDLGPTEHPDARDAAARIHVAAGRMRQLLDDLLRLGQLKAADIAREPIDLSRMAADILAGLTASAPDRHVDVQVADGLTVSGDTRLVRIAMENLLDNAWKYTARTPHARIDVRQIIVDGGVVTTIADNGAGYDPRYADRLFAPFQRLHKTADFEGAGIGLATVRRIVHSHGGRVWSQGSVGAGATFSFTLDGHAGAETPKRDAPFSA